MRQVNRKLWRNYFCVKCQNYFRSCCTESQWLQTMTHDEELVEQYQPMSGWWIACIVMMSGAIIGLVSWILYMYLYHLCNLWFVLGCRQRHGYQELWEQWQWRIWFYFLVFIVNSDYFSNRSKIVKYFFLFHQIFFPWWHVTVNHLSEMCLRSPVCWSWVTADITDHDQSVSGRSGQWSVVSIMLTWVCSCHVSPVSSSPPLMLARPRVCSSCSTLTCLWTSVSSASLVSSSSLSTRTEGLHTWTQRNHHQHQS